MKRKLMPKVFSSQSDLDSPESVERFRKLALAFTKRATVSKQAAISQLQKSGILDGKGNISKHYR